jgi:hypothetical protein
MLRLKYWFLNYVYDLVTFVSAIFLFLSLTLGYWLPNLAKAMGAILVSSSNQNKLSFPVSMVAVLRGVRRLQVTYSGGSN